MPEGCQTPVNIADKTIYGSLGALGAEEMHTNSAGTKALSDTDWMALWDNLNNPMFCMSYADFAAFKKEEEFLCSNYPCSESVQAATANLFSRILQHKAKANALMGPAE